MIKKIQLKNGFTVLLNKQVKSPVLNLQVWVGNGSAHETEEEAGLSHFIEHLVFKGTPSFGPGEIAQKIEGCGGQLNAYTTFDQTVFYVTLGRNEYKTGLHALSEMVFEPNFDPQEVNREREVVIEEIRRGKDDPSRVNTQFAFKNFFKGHKYSRPIIGYDYVVRDTPVEKIKDFFKSQYHPNNMFLLVSGDFDDSIIDDIKTYFEKESEQEFKERKTETTNTEDKSEFKFLDTKFEETFINLYWKAPDIQSRDFLCLEILALILGQGESSLLYKKLKLEDASVRSIGAFPFSIKHPGLFAITARPLENQTEKVIPTIIEVLNRLAKSGIKKEDFEKAIVNFKSDLYYSLETCDGLARQVGQSFYFYKDENYLSKYIELLDTIELNDINQVFEKYLLKAPNVYIASQNEDLDKPEFLKTFQETLTKKLHLESESVPRAKIDLHWTPRNKTSQKAKAFNINGVQILLKDQPETPIVHLDFGFLGGGKLESQTDDISSTFVQRCWARSSEKWNEERTLFELDKRASSLSAFSGKHSTGLQLTSLSSYRDEMLNLLPEFLNHTEMDSNILKRETALLLEAFKRRKDNPTQQAFLAFLKQAFKDHYYSKDSLEILSKKNSVNPDDISKHLLKHFDAKNMVISLVGDLGDDLDHIQKLLEKCLSHLPWCENPISFENQENYPKDDFVSIESEKEQSHIIFGFRGLNYKSKDRACLSVIQSLLSGQGGRLFIELRDKESLAYTVSPIRMEGQEGGYFGSYIACAPNKKDKALKMMKEEFEKLCQTPVPEAELQSAKKSLIGRMQISLQRNSHISETMFFDTLYGLDFETYLNFEKEIHNVSKDDIKDLMTRLYSRPHYTVCVG